jgi:hypothetical protein
MDNPPGDSSAQLEAEKDLLKGYFNKCRLTFVEKKKFNIEGDGWIEIDGFCESPLILCEAWAHIGVPKSAQKHKVMTDAFKLILVNRLFFNGGGMCILLFADNEAASYFKQRSWMAQCLKEYNIAVEVVELPKDKRDNVLNAQKRQYR